jgi:hypothetical protein
MALRESPARKESFAAGHYAQLLNKFGQIRAFVEKIIDKK